MATFLVWSNVWKHPISDSIVVYSHHQQPQVTAQTRWRDPNRRPRCGQPCSRCIPVWWLSVAKTKRCEIPPLSSSWPHVQKQQITTVWVSVIPTAHSCGSFVRLAPVDEVAYSSLPLSPSTPQQPYFSSTTSDFAASLFLSCVVHVMNEKCSGTWICSSLYSSFSVQS